MVLPKFVAHAVASAALLSPFLVSAQNASSSLPTVDLGYEIHRAAGFNDTFGYYNFSNIRYAAPPLGNLRFRAPTPPATNRSVINDGSIEHICPQASGTSGSYDYLLEYLATGQLPNTTTSTGSNTSTSSNSTETARDPRESEDCLFLDVIVPQKIFENAGQGKRAPVLVWIYGGGYTGGWKSQAYNPSGLFQRSITNSSDGVIFVAMNYRLGAFGFLSGPTLQQDGTANAALHDQRFALQWVQDNIHLFGGDKDRVTVFGQSAGGGSIIHQLTAYGGRSKPPFQQAIPQSPAWFPYSSSSAQEQVFQSFLEAANVSSLEEARNLPTEQLIEANAAQIAAYSSSQFLYGPSLDDDFVTEDPKQLLARGRYDGSVRVLVGHNSNEGLLFTPAVYTDAEVAAFIGAAFPSASAALVDYITTTLYPPVYNGTLYRIPFERLALMVSEAVFACNAFALSTARPNASHAYLFGVFPGLHGQDVAHTFYVPGQATTDVPTFAGLPFNETVALVLQDYITSFAVSGVPDSAIDGIPGYEVYGANASLVGLSEGGIAVQRDPAANERCKWWALGLLSA